MFREIINAYNRKSQWPLKMKLKACLYVVVSVEYIVVENVRFSMSCWREKQLSNMSAPCKYDRIGSRCFGDCEMLLIDGQAKWQWWDVMAGVGKGRTGVLVAEALGLKVHQWVGDWLVSWDTGTVAGRCRKRGE